MVIPMYNVEKYLDTCVKIVRKQTLQNIEIIIVDDG
ncbi:glycosyltransferase, partial [Bifidobacterium pseudocatenulatum]|nr:glycosyltransferase [Bifidobacterium pseudocatenulatum]